MGFAADLEALQEELTRAHRYKRAYDAIMVLREETAPPLPPERLDEAASKLGEAFGVCIAEMHAITGQLNAAYTAAAMTAAMAAQAAGAVLNEDGPAQPDAGGKSSDAEKG